MQPDDTQAEFDTAAALVDVVYIPELGATPMGELGAKADDLASGVITEEARKPLLLGGFSLFPFVDADTINITDNTHYITETLPTGNVQLSTAVQSMWVLKGTLAVDLHVLGELGGTQPGLAYLEKAELRNDSSPAPARRVKLPWGSYNFDVNLLTADGLEIMKRAIEWGAGAGPNALAPFAHWKLDDGTGPTAVDSVGGHDGTLVSNPDWVTGRLDGALDFNGTSDYVDAGTFDVSGSGLTMMGWFNAETIPTSDGRIVSKADGPNDFNAWWQLSTTDSGSNRYLRMRIKAGGTTTTLADSSVNLATGQWYFAVATYDNSGAMKLYLDGVEIRSGTHSVTGPVDAGPTVPVAIGANGTAERFFDGILDDVRVYDRALSATEISDLFAAGGGSGGAYIEKHQSWIATSDITWETFDLSTFGVPADAVVEVAITNSKDKNERWGGVRAVGSTLERRFRLHEAEGGGVDAVVMHVQANSSSQVQHFAEKKGEVTFTVLGYWTNATYVERFDSFSAGGSNSWRAHNLSAYGVGPSQVAEIAIINTNASNERLAGVRPSGSSMQRLISIHEAESGGIDAATMMVNADASGVAEVYAASDADIDFYVLGYWSDPPGTFVETGGVSGQVSTLLTWEANDLSTFGVPADSVAQFITSNESGGADVEIGVRQTGSSLNRLFNLQEAEGGRSDLATMHVNVDASSRVEWYAQYGGGLRFFYPIGWWVLN